MKLKNVLRLELKEQEEYFWYIGVSKPKSSFGWFNRHKAKELQEHSYIDVDYIKRLFFKSDIVSIIEIISILFKISEKKVLNLNIGVFVGVVKHIQNEIESILNEEEKLDAFNDPKIQMALKMSKAEIMNQFGIYNPIDSLAKGDKTKWEYFKNLTYREVRFMLTFDTVSNSVNTKFQKNYNDILKLENK